MWSRVAVLISLSASCHGGLLGAGYGEGSCAAAPYRAAAVKWPLGCPENAACCSEFGFCRPQEEWIAGNFRDCNGVSNGLPLAPEALDAEYAAAAAGDRSAANLLVVPAGQSTAVHSAPIVGAVPAAIYAAVPAVSYAAFPAASYAAVPATSYAAVPAASYATVPAASYGAVPANSYAAIPAASYAAFPAASYAAVPAASYASVPSLYTVGESYASAPAYNYAYAPAAYNGYAAATPLAAHTFNY